MRPVLLALGLLACDPDPLPLPDAAAVAEAARSSEEPPPTLAQALYDAPVAPAPTAEEQRVRLLLWLRRMDLDRGQLDRLDALRRVALDQQERVAAAEAEATAKNAPEAARVYGELWTRLSAGADPSDPALAPLIQDLGALSAGGAREESLLTVRMEGVRLVLEAERGLLDTLSETQEARLVEGLFALRRRLDPVGTPGDWDLLVGPSFEVGMPGLLLSGTTRGQDDPLNLGGLWYPGAEDPALPMARREAILFLVLLEPGLDEAIAAARTLAFKAP